MTSQKLTNVDNNQKLIEKNEKLEKENTEMLETIANGYTQSLKVIFDLGQFDYIFTQKIRVVLSAREACNPK